MKAGTIIKLFLIFFSMITVAYAQESYRTFYVNPIEISGLNAFRGKSMTIYYALGSRGTLNNQEDQITIREIKEKRTLLINGDTLNVPEVSLRRSNVLVSYSILVMVIHDGSQFFWVNGNRTIPDGQQTGGNSQYLMVDSLTKIEFEQLRTSQNPSPGTAVKYKFGFGVPIEPMDTNP